MFTIILMIITQIETETFLIVFDDMIAGIMTDKKFQAITKELFIRSRKLNMSLVFIKQSYFSIPKDVRLNSTHYLIMKIYNKRTKDSYNKLLLIVKQTLILNIL